MVKWAKDNLLRNRKNGVVIIVIVRTCRNLIDVWMSHSIFKSLLIL
jgi:hypothetical protein